MADSSATENFPTEAVELAGFVLLHCAVIADANREGELICPFAVLPRPDGNEVIDFESASQGEAVEKGWASLDEAKEANTPWAFGREGLLRHEDGSATDVLTVTVWLPDMEHHYSISQQFGRTEDQAIYLIGKPQLLKHAEPIADVVDCLIDDALERGIAKHPRGHLWKGWRHQ